MPAVPLHFRFALLRLRVALFGPRTHPHTSTYDGNIIRYGRPQISIVNGDKHVQAFDGAKCKSDDYVIDETAATGSCR